MEPTLLTQRLGEALAASGMTQADLARATGIDRGSISLYLNGKYNPKADKLHRLAAALGVTPEWLSGMESEPAAAPSIPLPICAGLDGAGMPAPTGAALSIPKEALEEGGPEDYFLLSVSGLAMYPRLLEGDLLLVRRGGGARDGAILVLEQDGALLVRTLSGSMLLPANPEFPPRPMSGGCRVLGRAVKLIRDLS